MRNITQKVKTATKQTAAQAAQMAADTVKRESLETLKTGTNQVAGREKITDRQNDPSIVNYIREQTAQNANSEAMREDLEKKRLQDLRMWQNKLEQLRYDMETRGQQQISDEQKRVTQIQEERMDQLTPQRSTAVEMPQSKPKGKGMMGRAKKAVSGVKNAIEQKMRKSETGRGAKG